MQYIPLVRSSGLVPFISFLKEIGTPTEKWLRRVRVPCSALEDPEALISMPSSIAFLDQVSRSEGLLTLGLLVGERTRIEQLGVFGMQVRSSLTLFEALHKAQQLITEMNSAVRIWTEQQGDLAWVFHKNLSPPSLGSQQVDQDDLMLIVNLIRLAAGPAWKPEEIRLQMPRGRELADCEAFCDCRMVFDQPASAIALPTELLSRPLIPMDSGPSIPGLAPEGLPRSALPLDFSGSLEQLLRSQLPEGYPGIQRVAEAAGTSARSLQRRLRGEGMQYARLVQSVRLDLARSLLSDSTFKLKDIAGELGYRDSANFTRAFRRWTGCSPHEFRQRHKKSRPL